MVGRCAHVRGPSYCASARSCGMAKRKNGSVKERAKPSAQPVGISSNWNKMKSTLGPRPGDKPRPGKSHTKKRPPVAAAGAAKPAGPSGAGPAQGAAAALPALSPGRLAAPVQLPPLEPLRAPDSELTERLALDCEMVGVGPRGSRSALAQVAIVNEREQPVYVCYVKPTETVTDFRTRFSGVRPFHLKHALPFERVQKEVSALLERRLLVGHALHNDLKALGLSVPRSQQRDTACYPPYRKGVGNGSRPQSLKVLSAQYLGWVIQTGEHSPLEDAVASLRLYQLKRQAWERGGGAAAMVDEASGGGGGGRGGGGAAAAGTYAAAVTAGSAESGDAAAADQKKKKMKKPLPATATQGRGVSQAGKSIHKPGKFGGGGGSGGGGSGSGGKAAKFRGKHKWSKPPGFKAPKNKGAFGGLLARAGF